MTHLYHLINHPATIPGHLHHHMLQAYLNIFDIPSNILPVRFNSRLPQHRLDLNPRSLELQATHLYKLKCSPSTYQTRKVCVYGGGGGGHKGKR